MSVGHVRSRAPKFPYGPGPNGATGFSSPTRVLEASEEADLVASLCMLRSKLVRLIRPALEKSSKSTKLVHFDQIVYCYQKSRPTAALRRRIDPILQEYNAVKQALVMANLAWVAKLSRAQRQANLTEDDLFQEGVCGLLKAIDRFESERGLRLMTYATWYIREAMQQARARQSHIVSLSTHDQTLLGQIEMHRSRFQLEHQRLPSAAELELRVNASQKAISSLERIANPTVSLERSGHDGQIPIPVEDPSSAAERDEEVRSHVAALLEGLTDRERAIVSHRFGLDGNQPTSLETLGDFFRVSKERIRQLQRQAIKRMCRQARELNLET